MELDEAAVAAEATGYCDSVGLLRPFDIPGNVESTTIVQAVQLAEPVEPADPIILIGSTLADLKNKTPLYLYKDNGYWIESVDSGLWLASHAGTRVIFADKNCETAISNLSQIISNHYRQHQAIHPQELSLNEYIRWTYQSETKWYFFGGPRQRHFETIGRLRFAPLVYNESQEKMARTPGSFVFVCIYTSNGSDVAKFLQLAFYYPQNSTLVVHDKSVSSFLLKIFAKTGLEVLNKLKSQGNIIYGHLMDSTVWIARGANMQDHCSFINSHPTSAVYEQTLNESWWKFGQVPMHEAHENILGETLPPIIQPVHAIYTISDQILKHMSLGKSQGSHV